MSRSVTGLAVGSVSVRKPRRVPSRRRMTMRAMSAPTSGLAAIRGLPVALLEVEAIDPFLGGRRYVPQEDRHSSPGRARDARRAPVLFLRLQELSRAALFFSSVVLISRQAWSIRGSVSTALSCGRMSVVQTNRVRPSASAKSSTEPMWCVRGPSTIVHASRRPESSELINRPRKTAPLKT